MLRTKLNMFLVRFLFFWSNKFVSFLIGPQKYVQCEGSCAGFSCSKDDNVYYKVFGCEGDDNICKGDPNALEASCNYSEHCADEELQNVSFNFFKFMILFTFFCLARTSQRTS